MNPSDPAYTERRASAHPTMGGAQHHHSSSHHHNQQQQQQQHHHQQQHQQHHHQQQQLTASNNASAPSAPLVPAGVPLTSPAAVTYFAAHPRRQQVYFGNYLLLQTLGEGEFGKVKLGVHREWGEEVAVKLIKRDKVVGGDQGPLRLDSSNKDPAKMTKVEREIQVLKDICHPNIVRLFEVIESDRYIGIVLEYASGGELFDHILAHKYLKEKDACKLFAQLISGVYYLHQKKIIHRDLKLENLLLDRNRNVIITDFGFANNFEDKRDDLMATSCGSPCYAAPELVVQDGLYAGSAVDVWSCGVILYAMLAGYLPFDDDPQNPDGDNINLLYKYIMATPLSFPDYITEQPRDLLSKMLVPDPLLRATLPMVMAHPWLSPYVELFKFSVDELERAAKEQQTRKRQAYHQQMLAQEKVRIQQNLAMGRSQTAADGLLLGAAGTSSVSGSTASNGLPLDTRQQRHQSAMATTSTVPDRLGQDAGHKSSSGMVPTTASAAAGGATHHGGRTTQRPTTAMPTPTAAPSPFGATGAGYPRPNMEILAAEAPAAAPGGWNHSRNAGAPTPSQAMVAAEEAKQQQSAGSKHQRHTIQLEYDSRTTSADAKRSASSRQHSNDVVPPVPKVPRVDSVPSSRKPSGSGYSPSSTAAGAGGNHAASNNAFVLEGKTTIVPDAEKQIQAELNRTPKRNEGVPPPSGSGSGSGSRTASGSGSGMGMPSPVTEVKTPPTASPSKVASSGGEGSAKTPQQQKTGSFAAAQDGSATPTASSVAAGSVSVAGEDVLPLTSNGMTSSSSPASRSAVSPAAFPGQESSAGSTISAISTISPAPPVPNNINVNGGTTKANGRRNDAARPRTAMPVTSGSMLTDTVTAPASTSSPPKSSESRAARHRKGLSTDKFFFSRLLGNSNNSPSSNNGSPVGTPSHMDDEPMENVMGPPSSTDIRRRDAGQQQQQQQNGRGSGGRRKAMSLVVSAGRANEQSPASRDREKAKLLAAQKEKEKENQKAVKEERRLTARFGRKDSTQQQPPSTPAPKGQTQDLAAGGATPSPGLTTPSVKGSFGPAGSSTNGSFRSPGFFDSSAGDSSSVGPSSSAAKKVMDWFRKKSLSKGNFTDQPPFDLDRSSLASGTPSRLGLSETVEQLEEGGGGGEGTPSRAGNGGNGALEDGTPRLVVTGAERSPDPSASMPSSRSTSGTHSQGTHYTSSTVATTVPDSIGSASAQKALNNNNNNNNNSREHGGDDDDARTATPRATPSVAQGPAGGSQLSLVRPFTDTVLREHLGAVDQSALTSRAPPQVFAEVRKALYEMGIEVRKERDEEFKLECVRRKKAKTLLGATQGLGLSIRSSVFRPSEAEMERSAAKASAGIPTSPSSAVLGGAETGSGIRNFLRRGTITASSPPMKNNASLTSSATMALGSAAAGGSGSATGASTPGNAGAGGMVDDPNAMPPPIYGEGSVDGGQEVRFSVEITRIKNLSGLYSVDIRRMKGNLWAYKFIYHALLDRCQLAGNGLA
ncbi:hypothetical protein CF327_g2519 [Tilletia walkeri]|nr:hypothetical protein CF327_g2519 [Tilletia walkeri]